jgi:hypothetical protein
MEAGAGTPDRTAHQGAVSARDTRADGNGGGRPGEAWLAPKRAANPAQPKKAKPIRPAGAAKAGRPKGAAKPVRVPAAGGAFAQLTALPAILVAAWLVPGLPLLLAGDFGPVAMLVLAAPLAVIAIAAGLRRVPGSWPRALPGARKEGRWQAWWGLLGTVAAATGFAAWQLIVNSVTLVASRDPGADFQSGYWIAQHGSLPIPQSLAAFGGAHPGLTFTSSGFLAHGTSLVPASLSGLPMLLAGGFWVHGISGASWVSPVLGALAVLAFGGLAGRLVGPQWAPAAALVLGFTLPEQYTSRSAFSEPLMQILLFGGLCLLVDALTLYGPEDGGGRADRDGKLEPAGLPRGWPRWLTPVRALAGMAGLTLGLTALVRPDGLFYLLPAIPMAGALLAGRRRQAYPFAIGLAAGAGYGLAAGYLQSRPYLDSLSGFMRLTGQIAAVLVVLTVVAVVIARSRRVRDGLRRVAGRPPLRSLGWVTRLRWQRWVPAAVGVAGVAALIGLAVRPYVQTVRGHPGPGAAAFVAALQQIEGIRVDPARLYAEDTLYWVIWYLGVPALLLAGIGVALVARRTLRALLSWTDATGAVRNWALPLMIIGWGAAAVLWRPDTVPDQPWASRRLVPLVLPGVVLLAIWASAWLVGRARVRGAGAAAWSFVAICCVAAVLVPTVVTTTGFGLTHRSTNGSLRTVALGLATRKTNAGETRAMRRLCTAIGGGATVVILDQRLADEFGPGIRGMCGVPVGGVAGVSAAGLPAVLSGIERAGRRPVLLAGTHRGLGRFGEAATQVINLRTTQDPHELTQPPRAPWSAHFRVWLAAPSASGVGA